MSNENEQPRDSASSRPSRLGRASVVLGTIGLVMIIIFSCGFLLTIETTLEHAFSAFCFMAVLSIYVAPLLALIGSCLAAAALLRKNRCRGVSITGLILNMLALLAFGLMLFWFNSAMEGAFGGLH